MTHKLIIGIDPGVPLTIAVMKDGEPYDYYEYEQVATQVDKVNRKSLAWQNSPQLVSAIIRDMESLGRSLGTQPLVAIERVSMRPEQDMRSGQEFVGSMYMCMGICAAFGIPYVLVPPSVWKPYLKVKVTLKNPKEPARLRALETWPKLAHAFARKKDHNRAEALLIAHYVALTGA